MAKLGQQPRSCVQQSQPLAYILPLQRMHPQMDQKSPPLMGAEPPDSFKKVSRRLLVEASYSAY